MQTYKYRNAAMLIIAIIVIVGCSPSQAVDSPERSWSRQAKIVAADGVFNDLFGISVAIDGDYAIVGANGDDDNGSSSGSAYIFHRGADGWTQQAKLRASDGGEFDGFGYAVAIDGNYAVVGARGGPDDFGAAYIFHRTGTTWTEQGILSASDGDAGDDFGTSVAIQGDYVVVGANEDDDGGQGSGSAYIFHRTGTTWTQQAKLTASDEDPFDNFGDSVVIDGNYVVVGASRKGAGAVYVFHRSGITWSEQEKLRAADGTSNDEFGTSVAIRGNYAVIGARGDGDNGDDSGSAYIFHRSGATWTQQAKLLASDGAADDQFGVSVSVDGDLAMIGAWKDDDNGNESGSAYLFRRNGGTWTQEEKFSASDGDAGDWFGRDVAVDGDDVIVGADRHADRGSAYIYSYSF